MGSVVFINLNNASTGGGGGGGGGAWGTITGTLSAQTDLQSALNGKANTSHTHAIANVTGLQSALDDKADIVHTHAYNTLTGIPSTFTPSAHTHNVIDINGVLHVTKGGTGSSVVPTNGQLLIGNGSGYSLSNITAGQGVSITNGPGSLVVATSFAPGYALWGSIGGTLSSQADLQSALNAKANTTHTHIIGDVTGLQVALDGKASTTHSHVIADTTGLQAALDGKAASAHTHQASDVTSGVFPIARGGTDISTTPTNGQILIGNGTGYNLTTMTAGTGITITNGAGSITIASTTAPGSATWGSISGTLSDQTDLQTALNAKAETLHTHTAANITSGVLSIAYGGTENVTVPANGQLLIGNGSGYTVNNITAGTGITVTNGVGTITIASTITPGSAVWGSITGTLSSQTDLNSALAGKANTTHTHLWADITDKPSTFTPTAHNHAATEITSGLLPIARGGTNIGTTPTNGQLLIGNGTGYAVANITAGSGITVTNGAGTITIAATASGSPFTTFGNTSYVAPGSIVGGTISGAFISGNYFFSPSNSYTVNVSNAGRSFTNNFIHTLESSNSATATFNGSVINGNFLAASTAITLNSNNNANDIYQNSVLSSHACNIYANNSSNDRNYYFNSLIGCSNVDIGAVSPSGSEQVAYTLAANNHQVILENTANSFYANLSRIRVRGGTNNNISMFNVPSGRSVTLDLNGNTNEGHKHVMSGGISLMPVVTGYTSQIRFYQTIPTANTTVPSPWYFTTLTIDSSALTSNVTFQLPSSNGSSGQFLTTNGSGVTSWANVSLSEVTLSQHTASPNNTVNATRILANAASTNADLVLQPKGSGSILAQIPDNGTAGGQKRGTQSVDLQLTRSSASQIVAGNNSFSVGGSNTVGGNFAAAMGSTNAVNANNSYTFGNSNTINATNCYTFGNSNTANGSSFAFAMGVSNAVSGQYSFGMGNSNTVSGQYSAAIGGFNTISSDNVLIIGSSNNSGTANTGLLLVGSSQTVPSNAGGSRVILAGSGVNNVYSSFNHVGLDRTGASWQNILTAPYTITLVNSQIVHIQANITCLQGTDRASYRIESFGYASGGTITWDYNQVTTLFESAALSAFDVRISSSGLNVLLEVFGNATAARWVATLIVTTNDQ